MSLSDKEIKELLEKAHAGDSKKAIECYTILIENSPLHPYYFSQRAIYRSLFSLDDAIGDISKAIELSPDKGEYYLRRGEYLLMKLDDMENADKRRDPIIDKVLQDYKTCIEKDPVSSQAWLNLMELNMFLHNWDDVISLYGSCKPFIEGKDNLLTREWFGCLSLALAGDPIGEEDKKLLSDYMLESSEYFIRKRIVSLLKEIRSIGAYDSKWKEVFEIHRLFSLHFTDLMDVADEFELLGCFDAAIQLLDKMLDGDPHYNRAWEKKISIFKKLEGLEKADELDVINKMIEQEPNIESLWLKKAGLLKDYKRFDEALNVIDEALKRKLDANGWMWSYKIDILKEDLKRNDEALQACDKWLEISPDGITALDRKAELLYDCLRFKETLKVLEKLIALKPNTWEYWSKKVIVCEFLSNNKEGDYYEEALEALVKVEELNSGYFDFSRGELTRNRIISKLKR